MAKKNDTKSKAAAPAAPSVPVTPAAPAPVAKAPAPAKKPAAKPKAKKKPAAAKAKPATKPAPLKAPVYTRDDIALRAYFIAEKRQAHGLPGNEHLDWVEAERQLATESSRPKKTSKA